MKLYDTKRREVVEIIPSVPGVLKIYACGPTVYRDAHVGNMRTFLLTDLIKRFAQYQGLRVELIQNITDVGHMADDTGLGGIDEGQGDTEDRVLAQAKTESVDALSIARKYEDNFHKDLKLLNIQKATQYPRASESIELMIELIKQLIEKKHAYVGKSGTVFFDAKSFPSYGQISGNKLDELQPGYRFEGKADPDKKFHADWALWKHAGENRTQLTWETPWGRGYPGWHIECSAMSIKFLGNKIDIHTGGIDLRFPHHEDERAQSNASTNTEVVNHWIHGEHLLFEGRKMSKSSGNVLLVSEVVAKGLDPLAIRLSLLEHRYRSQMDLTWNSISASHKNLNRIREKMQEWAKSSGSVDKNYLAQFESALNEDLDTNKVLQLLRTLEKDETVSPGDKHQTTLKFDEVLGLDLNHAPEAKRAIEITPEIKALLETRAKARLEKNWKLSDEIRDKLITLGIGIKDSDSGQEIISL
ncbi:MAG: cysteine--tRNA ligase [Actinomycetes bacterium]